MDRQDWLAGLGTMAARMTFVNNANAQERNPATAVTEWATTIEALIA